MKRNQLGTSSLYVSEIGFGCMSLQEDSNENRELLMKAYHRGINFFDTADLYNQGENEVLLGKALRGVRDKVIISTKVGNQWTEGLEGWVWNPTKKYILKAVEESLRRLNTEYIDLYQLHGGTIEDPIDETIEAFELLQTMGKIRHYGISSIRPNVIREYISRSNIVSVMMQYSLLDRRPEECCLETLQKNQIGVLARGSLVKGMLIDKPPSDFLNYSSDEVKRVVESLKIITEYSSTELAIRFSLNHSAVASAVVGFRTLEQLQQGVKAGEASPFSSKVLETLLNSTKINVYDQHR